MFATSPSPRGRGQMASAGESLLHSTTAPSPGEDEVGRVVECTSHSGPDVELAETSALESRMVLEILESRTSFSGPSVELAETLEVRLEVRRTLGSTFASVLMVCVAPPVGDSVTELLEFATSLEPSSLA